MAILHLSRFLLQMEGSPLYYACFNANTQQNVFVGNFNLFRQNSNLIPTHFFFEAMMREQIQTRLICTSCYTNIRYSNAIVVNVHQKTCITEKRRPHKTRRKIKSLLIGGVRDLSCMKYIRSPKFLSSDITELLLQYIIIYKSAEEVHFKLLCCFLP